MLTLSPLMGKFNLFFNSSEFREPLISKGTSPYNVPKIFLRGKYNSPKSLS